jgi:hypothetical protein
MDINSAINTARKAGYTATKTDFFEKRPHLRYEGILLNPGQMVLSIDDFIRFVADGCKNPERYQKGVGFQAVFGKDIDQRLAELLEAQKPFIEPLSPEVANRRPWTPEEMDGYAQRKLEIDYLQEERIKIQKWFDSLTKR